MITFLLATCFVAITGYCLVVIWPRLSGSLATHRQVSPVRQQARVQRSLYDINGNRSTERPRLLKK